MLLGRDHGRMMCGGGLKALARMAIRGSVVLLLFSVDRAQRQGNARMLRPMGFFGV
jgi:hypothetical protein